MENDQTEAEIDETIEERISNTSQHSDENGQFLFSTLAPRQQMTRGHFFNKFQNNFWSDICSLKIAIMVICSKNIACLAKFKIIFAHQKIGSNSAKVLKNLVRQVIFLKQKTTIIIFSEQLTKIVCRNRFLHRDFTISAFLIG